MKTIGKGRCTLGTVALAIAGMAGLSTPSGAQDSEPAADESSSNLSEVVVSARRREENLQDVPISVTALSQDELRENGVTTFNDLQHLVTSMTLVNSTSRNEQFVSIRGISGLATDGQAVISYLNEVPLPQGVNGGTGGGGPGQFYDLDTIQVLKGPQGTLFGRNTIGGAILYQTRRPTDTFDGYLEGTVGNDSNTEIQGAVNLPVAEQLQVRLAFNRIKRDGFTKSLGTLNHPDGTDLDNRDVTSARATVRFSPNEKVQNDFIYSYLYSSDHGSSQILTYLDPNGLSLAIYPEMADLLEQQQALGIRTQLPTDTATYSRSNYQSFSNLFRYELSDSLVLRNITSWSELTSINSIDSDGTDLPNGNSGDNLTPYSLKIFTEEPQLQGTIAGGNLQFTIGGYYENRPKPPVYRTDSVSFGSHRIREVIGWLGTDANSKALYAQGTYDLSGWIQNLKLSAGYRYSWDAMAASATRGLDANGDCLVPPPGADENCFLSDTAEFSGSNWMVGLDYNPTPRTLLYVVARHGYHSGGLNLSLGFQAPTPSYQPETGTDVEIGLKSDWAIGELEGRTNISAYRFNYDDVQTFAIVPVGDGTFAGTFGNAAGARTVGAELEATLLPTPNFEVGVQFDWMDFKYTDFGPGVDAEQLVREETQNRPKYKYGVNARYHLPVASTVGDVSVMARWSWQDETVISAFLAGPSPEASEDAYGLLTLGASWNEIGGRPLDAQLYVTNALDKDYKSGGRLYAAATGIDNITYGEPRMYGLRLRYSFGAAP